MLPLPTVAAWREDVNWPLDDQVEQDLIISRVLVELFSHHQIKNNVAFRGGTALHKLVFPQALRYSEDIDLNRLENNPAGPLIDAVREVLQSVFDSNTKVKKTARSIKLTNSYESVVGGTRKLKVEINVQETLPQKSLVDVPFFVQSDYFKGDAVLKMFNPEEMIGTKMRALYQRNKGRDLFDLYKAKDLDLNWDKVVASYQSLNIGASKDEYLESLNNKMDNKEFIEDINPLLPSNILYDPKEAYVWFVSNIFPKM